MPKRDPDDDAKADPNSKIAFESRHCQNSLVGNEHFNRAINKRSFGGGRCGRA